MAYHYEDVNLLELESSEQPSSLPPRSLSGVINGIKLRPHLGCVQIPQRSPETQQIPEFFESLRRHGVTRIKRLEVDEDIRHPHSDEDIINAIKDFHIEELDWRKTDMCNNVLLQGAPELRQVNLYSSGSEDVLNAWSGVDGLIALAKLENISISMLQAAESINVARHRLKQFEEMWLRTKSNNGRFVPIINELIILQEGYEMTTWSKAMAQLGRFSEHTTIVDLLRLSWGYGAPDVEVKVAIIDDGVDIEKLDDCVVAGRSFIRGEARPYYLSATGRGTRIASIVSRFYPGARFYSARVDPTDPSADPLTEALGWAVQQKVDLIIIGAPMETKPWGGNGRLHVALWETKNRGIPILCPARELAQSGADPQRWTSEALIHITARGVQSKPPADFAFRFRGLELAYGISASLAATAFAAGIAALIAAARKRFKNEKIHWRQLRTMFRSQSLGTGDSPFVSIAWLINLVEEAKELGDGPWLLEKISESLPSTAPEVN